MSSPRIHLSVAKNLNDKSFATDETVCEDECSTSPPIQTRIVWTDPSDTSGLAPGHEVSSETPPSGSEESWSDLEFLSNEIDCVDNWKH